MAAPPVSSARMGALWHVKRPLGHWMAAPPVSSARMGALWHVKRPLGRWMAAPLLAVALCLLVAGPVSAADSSDDVVISVGESDSLGLVRTAQSDGTDTEPVADRRLVGRESGERVDAVVIALWTIAAVMTVLLGIFLWHTSPRRRARLAGVSAELFDEADTDSELAGRQPAALSTAKDLVTGVWERVLAWSGSRGAPAHDAESFDADSEQESMEQSEQEFVGQSEDESAVWKFGEQESTKQSEREFVGQSEDESAVWKFGEQESTERSEREFVGAVRGRVGGVEVRRAGRRGAFGLDLRPWPRVSMLTR